MPVSSSFEQVMEDISILYELSLSIGQSLDLRKNCDLFAKTLLTRKNLSAISIWIKESELERVDEEGNAILVYANPRFRVREEAITVNHEILKKLNNEKAFSIASTDNDFSKYITEKDVQKGLPDSTSSRSGSP